MNKVETDLDDKKNSLMYLHAEKEDLDLKYNREHE
jgi:hypothetical protein